MNAVDFFNSLSGRLVIKLSEPARPVGQLLNVAASPTAQIQSVSFEVKVFESRKFRPLTDEEWRRVVIPEAHLRMASGVARQLVIEHTAPNPRGFDVRALCDALAKTEHVGRQQTEWFGGIDVHHVTFEGLTREGDVWIVNWGS